MQAALSTLIGTAGSYAYLSWLIHDMDGLSEDMVVPFRNARALPAGPVRTVALGFAAYRCAAAPAFTHDGKFQIAVFLPNMHVYWWYHLTIVFAAGKL